MDYRIQGITAVLKSSNKIYTLMNIVILCKCIYLLWYGVYVGGQGIFTYFGGSQEALCVEVRFELVLDTVTFFHKTLQRRSF